MSKEKQNRYKINMAARQAGVTPQTVRYYEKEGLIEAHRDPYGTTRYYNTRHFKQLANVRRYYRLGFSDQEVRFLLQCEQAEEMRAFFLRRAEEQEAEIAQMRLRAAEIRRQAKDLERIQNENGACSLVRSPALVLLITRIGNEMLENPDVEEVLGRWLGSIHLVRLASRIKMNDFVRYPDEILRSSGYCIYEEDLPCMGAGKGDACLIHVAPRLSVRAICRLSGESLSPKSILSNAYAFLSENHLTVDGDVVGRCLAVLGEARNRTEGHPHETWYEYWIPVLKSGKSSGFY